MLSQTFGSDLFSDVINILRMNPQTQFPDAWSLIENIHTSVIMPLALSFVTIHFLMAILDKASSDNSTGQHYLYLCVKLLAAKYFIENGLAIFTEIINGGNQLISGMSAVSNSTSGFDQALWQTITGKSWSEDVGFMESIGYMLYIVIPWLCSFLLGLLLKAMAYTRLVTILIRVAFAPLAVSDFFTEGVHGAGWRYIKNTVAAAIQGVVMLAVVSICAYIIKGVIDVTTISGWSYLKFTGAYFAIAGCCTAMLGKSQQMAKEIMGTG